MQDDENASKPHQPVELADGFDRLYSLPRAEERLFGLTAQQIRRLIAEGKILARQVNDRLKIPGSEFRDLADKLPPYVPGGSAAAAAAAKRMVAARRRKAAAEVA